MSAIQMYLTMYAVIAFSKTVIENFMWLIYNKVHRYLCQQYKCILQCMLLEHSVKLLLRISCG